MLCSLRKAGSWVAALLVLAFSVVACAPPQQKPFEFHFGSSGKADGVGLISAEDRDRIDQAFVTAIQKGEAEVKRLEAEIARLEGDIAKKQAEIDSLLRDIENRKSELESQRAWGVGLGVLGTILTAPFGGWGGAVAYGGLALAISNDYRIRELESRLSQARTSRDQISNQRSAYFAKKAVILAQVDKIRAGKQRLLAQLASPTEVVVPEKLGAYGQTTAPFRRWKTMEGVLKSVRAEIAALTELRDAAKELLAAVEGVLATVQQLAEDADKMVQDSRDEFLFVLELALSGDPAALATKWLSNILAKKTQEILTELGFPAADFVAHLVRMRFTGSPEDIEALSKQLVDKLTNKILDEVLGEDEEPSPPPSDDVTPTPPPSTTWHYETTSTTPVAIPDMQLVSSTVSVPKSGHVTGGKVSVSIDHSYVGDLVLMLSHGNTVQVLVKQTDDLESSVHETWALDELLGADASGDWELLISDEGKGDTGTLQAWTLTLDGAE